MKNMLLVAIIMVAQAGYAAPKAVEAKAKTETTASHEAKVQNLNEASALKDIAEKVKTGKSLTAKEKAALSKGAETALEGTSVSANNIKLIIESAPEVLVDVQAQGNIIRSKSSTKEQIEQAELSLKVYDAAARSLDVNAPSFKSDLATIVQISKLPNFTNSDVVTFKNDFKRSLDNGKSLADSLNLAAAKQAKAKNMTVKEWLEKFKELCA